MLISSSLFTSDNSDFLGSDTPEYKLRGVQRHVTLEYVPFRHVVSRKSELHSALPQKSRKVNFNYYFGLTVIDLFDDVSSEDEDLVDRVSDIGHPAL